MIPRLLLAGVAVLLVAPYSWPAAVLVVAVAGWMVAVERRRA